MTKLTTSYSIECQEAIKLTDENISMRLQRKLHNNTSKVTILSVPAKPEVT
jgi:hypothetical protein